MRADTINCEQRLGAHVQLHDFTCTDEWVGRLAVTLYAPGLDSVAESYAGWEGELTWRTLSGDLAVSARAGTQA